MKLQVLIRTEAEGGYSASVPALPGCYSQGESFDEVLANIREAAELWLEVAAETAANQAKMQGQDATLQEIEL
jgi:predicted RNase H-like HicB family nuclease